MTKIQLGAIGLAGVLVLGLAYYSLRHRQDVRPRDETPLVAANDSPVTIAGGSIDFRDHGNNGWTRTGSSCSAGDANYPNDAPDMCAYISSAQEDYSNNNPNNNSQITLYNVGSNPVGTNPAIPIPPNSNWSVTVTASDGNGITACSAASQGTACVPKGVLNGYVLITPASTDGGFRADSSSQQNKKKYHTGVAACGSSGDCDMSEIAVIVNGKVYPTYKCQKSNGCKVVIGNLKCKESDPVCKS
jgi:hypothetical protein